MKRLIVFLFLAIPFTPQAQEATVVFYNVENLFDTEDDSLKRDEEFLPQGVRGWTPSRLRTKYHQIYKVIVGIGQSWQPPALVALAEVENRRALEGLLKRTPLHRQRYQIVHEESPDQRGIDVALLYDPAQFQYLTHRAIPVDLSGRPTRDILYVRGILFGTDTLHYFINHWPSRYGGTTASAARRQQAAAVLRRQVDTLQQHCPDARVVVAGDFNDNPDDVSLLHVTEGGGLVNVSRYEAPGTHKYQGAWSTFDQMIVSANLLASTSPLRVVDQRARCFRPDWLAEEDAKHLGYQPRRTYVGYRYHGGFSDHWPVYLLLKSARVAKK